MHLTLNLLVVSVLPGFVRTMRGGAMLFVVPCGCLLLLVVLCRVFSMHSASKLPTKRGMHDFD